ncbi:hypothetical protein Nizo2814_3197 [Lactiplantibacillus plantarum]|nr:hypothetical protein Nizo2814_3197 [Lactiplantibacillus plantarum]
MKDETLYQIPTQIGVGGGEACMNLPHCSKSDNVVGFECFDAMHLEVLILRSKQF